MSAKPRTLISVEEYLHTAYSPDREYRDGVLVERNLGDWAHARLQALLSAYIIGRETQWNVVVSTELRIRVREHWYPLPDLCIYNPPAPQERYPNRPPLLWVEILSEDDTIVDVWAKAGELIENGVPYVWIIDPHTLKNELWTVSGAVRLEDRVLRLPNTDIVIPLPEVMSKK